MTGDWSNQGGRFNFIQTGNSVAFSYDNEVFNHFGSGIYDKDGKRLVLNLARVTKSNGCRVKGTSTIEVVTCGEIRSATSWDAGCDLSSPIVDALSLSRRVQ